MIKVDPNQLSKLVEQHQNRYVSTWNLGVSQDTTKTAISLFVQYNINPNLDGSGHYSRYLEEPFYLKLPEA